MRSIPLSVDPEAWERLLEIGTPNELRCAVIEMVEKNPRGEELHWRLMELIEAMHERGVVAGGRLAKQEVEAFLGRLSRQAGKAQVN